MLSRIYYDQQRNHLTNLKIYVKKGTKGVVSITNQQGRVSIQKPKGIINMFLMVRIH